MCSLSCHKVDGATLFTDWQEHIIIEAGIVISPVSKTCEKIIKLIKSISLPNIAQNIIR